MRDLADTERRVCAVCSRVLEHVARISTDESLGWRHSIQDAHDHPPVPVLDRDATPLERCDFCNADEPTWTVHARDFRMPPAARGMPIQQSVGDWAACDECAQLVAARAWRDLSARVITCYVYRHGSEAFPGMRGWLDQLYRLLAARLTGEPTRDGS